MKQAVVTIKYDEESRGDVPPAIKKANRQQGKNSAASGSAAENE